MSSIVNNIVSVAVTNNTVFPSRAGFGTPMFCAVHSLWPQRIRQFSSNAEVQAAVLAGGGTATHPIALAANVAFSQAVTPKKWCVGKRNLAFTQTVVLTVKNATEGYVYDFDIYGTDGVKVNILYTVLAAETTTTVAAALEALIEAVRGIASSASAAVITAVTTAGSICNYARLPPISVLGVATTTADPGLATDLTAIELATSQAVGIEWYGFSLDNCDKAEFEAASAWVESRNLVFAGRQTDSEVADSADTNCAFSLAVAASRKRTLPMFARGATHDYRDAAVLAAVLPDEPGSYTFAFKSLVNVSVDQLSAEERSAVLAKRGTVYEAGAGINVTFEGKTPKGGWFDETIAADFVTARVREDLYAFFVQNKKIPYTQAGIDAALMVVQNRLDKCTRAPNEIFSLDRPPTVTAILVEDTEASDRAARRLTNIVCDGVFTGALHGASVTINIGI